MHSNFGFVRQFTIFEITSNKPPNDAANKAVILSCSDALLSITFTGLGGIGTTYVDEWLLDILREEGLCELEANIAIEKFSVFATNWFRSLPSTCLIPHSFIFAGFQKKSSSSRYRARLWFVDNSGSDDLSSFKVRKANKPWRLYVTGWLPAFARDERRRLQAAIRNSKSIEEIEVAMVNGIRNAASRVEGDPKANPIGKDCMSVVLSSSKIAVSSFHPNGKHPNNFAPHCV